MWAWGPPDKEKKRMHDILNAIMLYGMMLDMELGGMVLAQGPHHYSKIA